LSEAGLALLERLEPLLRALAKVPAEMKALREGQVGHLRVAFTGLAMATVLPRILREFHRKHPGIRLELNESPSSAQLLALKAGEIACGFFHPDAETPGIKTRMLLREKNGVLLPTDHALAGKSSVSLKELRETPFVLFPRSYNPGFYDRVLAAFAEAGVSPRIAEEVWPRSNGVGLVRAGLGATFMSPSEAKQLPPEVVFCPLQGPAPESRLVMGWVETSERPSALQALISLA
jgi:DNA-binding transcriptional LysR family regulator